MNFQLVKETIKPKVKNAKETFYLLNKNRLSQIALYVLLLILVLAVLAPVIVPHPEHIADEANMAYQFTPPCSEYPFGTDEL